MHRVVIVVARSVGKRRLTGGKEVVCCGGVVVVDGAWGEPVDAKGAWGPYRLLARRSGEGVDEV